MRALLIILYVASLVSSPLAADPVVCTHDDVRADSTSMHDMAGTHADTAHDTPDGHDGDGCQCDPGCAGHCEGAAPAALVLSTPVQGVMAATVFRTVALPVRHADPPRAAPLRPPQAPVR